MKQFYMQLSALWGNSHSCRIAKIKGLALVLFLLCTAQTLQAQQVYNFEYTGSIVEWTVPAGVSYISIEANGAQGGNNGGKGANMKGNFTVTPGEKLKILVGQKGLGSHETYPETGGGGGGTFVWKETSNSLLIVAGGGGGRASNSNSSTGGPGSSTNISTASVNGSGNGNGGVNGNGGTGGAPLSLTATYNAAGGGGAGWLSNGLNGTGTTYNATGGKRPLEGGQGGTGVSPGYNTNVVGGFGGGGGGAGNSGAGGGGGGYNGGGGGNNWSGSTWGSGGGGGSYNAGTDQVNTAGVNAGNGKVVITTLYAVNITETKPLACASDNSGELTATVLGGTAPYNYSWSPTGGTSAVATNLTAGTYTVTVTDALGEVTTATKTLSVTTDSEAPVIKTKAFTAVLDASGKATITATDLDNGTSDNSGSYTLSFSQFGKIYATAPESGNVTLTAPTGTVITAINFASYGLPTGTCGNFSIGTCHAANSKVIVEGLALGKNTVTISAINDIFGDPCYTIGKRLYIEATYGTPQPSLSFTCSNLGEQNVTLYALDANGNVSSEVVEVTVVDNINPTITAPIAVTVNTDAGKNTASGVVLGTPTIADNCTTTTTSNAPATFPVGNTTVTWKVEDAAGNTATATQIVTVADNEKPVPTIANLPTITGECSATVTAPTATDNVAGTVTGTTTAPLEYTQQGTYTITWTYSDGNGNTTTQTQQVIVKDETKPVFAAIAPITKTNDANKCGAIVTYTMPTATDNCSALPDPNAVYTLNYAGQLYDYVSKRFEAQSSPGLPLTFNPTDGNKMAVFLVNSGTMARLYQDVTLPSSGPVILSFDLQYKNHHSGFSSTQFMAVEIRDPNTDALLRTVYKTEPGAALSTPMTSYNFDISEFNGQQVRLVMTNTTIHSFYFDILLDNVKIAGSTLVNGSFETGEYTGWAITENSSGAWGIGSGKATPVTIAQTAGLASGALFPVGTTTNTFVATDAAGNESEISFNVTVTDTQKPTVVTQNITVNLDATGNATITPAQINNGSTDNCSIPANGYSLDKSAFTCANVGVNTVTLTVTDANGNTSSKTAIVTVKDITLPTAKAKNITVQLDAAGAATITPAMVDNGSSDVCGNVSLTLSEDTFGCSNLGTNTVTLTVTDAAGNKATAEAIVTVKDEVAPVSRAKNYTVALDATGKATIAITDVNNGSSDNCGIETIVLSKTAFDCSNVGENEVTLTVTDKSGNKHEATAIVTVVDETKPSALAKNITVQLDATGNASVAASDINNGSSDACGIKSMTLSKSTFDCTNVGDNSVTLTVTDNNDNIATATVTVKVEDKVIPVAKAQNVTIELDANGVATITADDVDNGSTDACGAVTLALTKTDFTCANVGTNTVTLTVTDKNDNKATVDAIITVVDNLAPVARAKNITVQLDATGNATITTAQVNNGSSDNCGIKTMSLDKTKFDCSQVGENEVILTVTDVNNNTHSATAIVTVEDKVAPTVITQNITVQLDATGKATITVADIDNGSSDACGIRTMTLDNEAFDCSNIGANTVTLTVTDNNGNVTIETATVTVEDKIAPIAITKNITVKLDAAGKATIVAADVNNGSSDICGDVTLDIDKTAFDCSNVGDNTVILTVTDAYGNAAEEKATVTIVDDLAPTVITQNITVKLDATGNATITTAQIDNGSSDNCGIADMELDVAAFTCEDAGTKTVTLTVTDVNGNEASQTATVTIVDEIAPTAVAKNITAELDKNGTVTITAEQIDNGSTDNCGIADMKLIKDTFDCSNVATTNEVILTVTDKAGNKSTATAIVTIVDNIAPTITAPADLVLDVDAGKTTASNVDLGTPVVADNCDAANVTATPDKPTEFEYPAGTTIVTWTAEDAAGNKTTATQTVTVRQDIVSVAALATINVPIRTAYANVPLPATVEVTYTNGEKEAIGVTWAQGTYNGLVAGTYALTGQLIPAANTTNRNSKVATISVVVEPNKAPTALAFSATTFKPEAKTEDVIGTLTTTDADDTEFVYTLVAGEGDAANNLFEIRGDNVHLKSNNGLSGKTTFSIRVRSTDPYQNTIEKVFTLNKESYTKPVDKLKIVNAFSPNNDGMNDTWTIPELRFYNSVEIEVFDRSGVRLFHTTDPEKGWDGRGLNGQILKGAFFYIVQVKDIDLVKKGVVTILKK